MPTINEMFPGRFLRGRDLKKPARVTIRQITQQEMYSRADRAKLEKWVIYFRGSEKGMVLNVTNAEKIAEITKSRNSDDWIGHTITLYPAKINVAGETQPAIRIRAPGKTNA